MAKFYLNPNPFMVYSLKSLCKWYFTGCRFLVPAENVPGIDHFLDLENLECTWNLIFKSPDNHEYTD